MDHRWLLRHRYRWLRLRPAGTVRLLYTTGAFWPRFFIWRINDNHGPGTDSFHRRTSGLRDLRSVHHARRNGPTLLAIPLLRRGRIDSVIFVGLIVILIYNNVTNHGALITTWLLSALALMGFYIFWIRVPKIIFKQKGFFFANVWIEYSRIKAMNLSEDGVLVMQLEQRRLLIRVRNIDDLEKVYKLLVSTQ